MVRLIITKSSKFTIYKVYFSQAYIETNVLSLGLCPDCRSLGNLLYISVWAFSISNSIRVLKSTTEKVLETVKNKGRNKGFHSGRPANPGLTRLFFDRGTALVVASSPLPLHYRVYYSEFN